MIRLDSQLVLKHAENYERCAQYARDEAKQWRGESQIWYEQSLGKADVYDSVARDMRLLAEKLENVTHVLVPVQITNLRDEGLGYAAEVRIGFGRYTSFGKTPADAVADLQRRIPE